MNLFYTPDISGETYSLNEAESRHCQKVLRLQQGDVIHLTNGRGTLFEARITDTRSRLITVSITGKVENFGRRDYHLHLAVAPTKNIDRFEWFLEKATEIGVDEITPLICEHSERKHLRIDRLEKVVTAAMKQSLKAYHPMLNNVADFARFVSLQREGQLFIAHLDEHDPLHLQKVYNKGADVTVLIGPEGDFSESELSMAERHSFQRVSLGDSRLRTETAAVVACHTIRLINQK